MLIFNYYYNLFIIIQYYILVLILKYHFQRLLDYIIKLSLFKNLLIKLFIIFEKNSLLLLLLIIMISLFSL